MEPEKLPFKDYQAFRKTIGEIEAKNQGCGFLYKLYSVENGKRIPVCRVAGKDEAGILYIGQTTKLVDRLSLLYRSFEKRPNAGKLWQHGADEIYWQCQKMQEEFPFNNMVVEITPCENSAASEIEAISSYYTKFGEVPPFNGAIVKKRKV